MTDSILAAQERYAVVNEIKIPVPGKEAWFGAPLSKSGDLLLVGAQAADIFGPWSGAAYLFRVNTVPAQCEAVLLPPSGDRGDYFGAVSLDSERAAVGAYGADTTSIDSGAVYIFERRGRAWQQTAVLEPPRLFAAAAFGAAICLNGDSLLVGAPHANAFAQSAGTVFEYRLRPNGWMYVGSVAPSKPAEFAQFGASMVVAGDQLLVGAPSDAHGAGAAYVFERRHEAWTETGRLVAIDAKPGQLFGMSLGLTARTAVIGAPLDTNTQGLLAGSAYIFERRDAGWMQTTKLLAPEIGSYGMYGIGVAIDGGTIAVGRPALLSSPTPPGSIGLYRNIAGSWQNVVSIVPPRGKPGDGFGYSPVLEGSRLFVGAPTVDHHGVDFGGAVFEVFIGPGD